MSRSRRKPYYKDRGFKKNEYWKTIRREWRQDLNNNWGNPDFQLRKPQEIINDYDYCDWWSLIEVEHENSPYEYYTEELVEKYRRK